MMSIMARSSNVMVIKFAVSALSSYSNHDEDPWMKTKIFIEKNMARRMVELSMHENIQIRKDSLRFLSHVASAPHWATGYLHNCGVMEMLRAQLAHERMVIVKHALFLLSNLIVAPTEQRDKVIKSGVLPVILRLWEKREVSIAVKEEISYVMVNCLYCHQNEVTLDHAKYCLDIGFLPAALRGLESESLDIVAKCQHIILILIEFGRRIMNQSIFDGKTTKNPVIMALSELNITNYMEIADARNEDNENVKVYEQNNMLKAFFVDQEEEDIADNYQNPGVPTATPFFGFDQKSLEQKSSFGIPRATPLFGKQDVTKKGTF